MTSAAEPGQATDVRPVVPLGSQSNAGMWFSFGLLAIGGAVLFNALNASKEAAQAPSVFQTVDQPQQQISSPPPLAIPERFTEPLEDRSDRVAPSKPARQTVAPPARAALPVVRPTRLIPPPGRQIPPVRQSTTPPLSEPQVVYERSSSAAATSNQDQSSGGQTARVTASRFLNPSLTIPQGTVIPAVLETALDSTRPGGVRALVQRDVSSFDGSRILIPRGSRLYGEYEANLQPGQNRALVQWSRLIRPDGVTINLDSPSSDPLGRAGIKGKVDSKFLQRFGSAILQSVVDLGINVAVSEATDGVILALPGSTQNVQVANPQAFLPTLKVKHGASVSVFVARDLDFSTVDS